MGFVWKKRACNANGVRHGDDEAMTDARQRIESSQGFEACCKINSVGAADHSFRVPRAAHLAEVAVSELLLRAYKVMH
jgi:hypothetical protein